MNKHSDTPETDAAEIDVRTAAIAFHKKFVYSDVARKLERERDEARKELAELRAQLQPWIPVSERLPERYASVIVWGELEDEEHIGNAAHEGYFSGERWHSVRFEEGSDRYLDLVNVTHWQPMPKGPTA